MNELNSFRKKNYLEENAEFHARVNPYKLLQDKDVENDSIFVAVNSDGEIIGYIWGSLYERKNYRFDKLGYIDELYVQPEYRGQGVARKLYKKLVIDLKN